MHLVSRPRKIRQNEIQVLGFPYVVNLRFLFSELKLRWSYMTVIRHRLFDFVLHAKFSCAKC